MVAMMNQPLLWQRSGSRSRDAVRMDALDVERLVREVTHAHLRTRHLYDLAELEHDIGFCGLMAFVWEVRFDGIEVEGVVDRGRARVVASHQGRVQRVQREDHQDTAQQTQENHRHT